ncbi:MAG TPA: hypothetical protein PLU17_03505, partial [Chitinophagaceae bacterium]|nr:hypothetical protein [Chitinophagaceae bacterium]
MRKTLLLFVIACFLCINKSWALISVTVTGNTNTVPVIAASYVSLSSAIAALNSVTAINGPVTFNLASGSTETTNAQYTITQAGSALYPITFQKNGVNANPKLTRQDGGILVTTGNGGYGDGVLRIDGTDNIHFNGLDIASASMGIEYGYYFHKPNGANGSQNVSIKNSNITMTKGTSAFVIGIYINNGQTALSASDGVTLTAASGQHMNFLITGNTIQNVHRGIYCYGYYANYIAPYYYDRNFTIGQMGAGNIIQNFGGGVANISAGISSKYIINLNINYNTIHNASGGGVPHISDLFGLDIYGSTGYCSYSNNAITLTNTTGEVNWISNYSFGFSLQIPGKTALMHNNIFGGSVASAISYLMYNSVIGDSSFLSARNNTISGTINMAGTTGSIYGYYASSNSFYKQEVIGNTISNLTTPSASYGVYVTGGQNDSCIIDSNIITNLNTTSTVLPFIYGIYVSNVIKCLIRDNIVSNLGSYYTAGIRLFYSSYNPSIEILRNKIYSLSSGASSSSGSTLNGIYVNDNGRPGFIKIHNNLIGLLTAPVCTSTNAITALETSCSGLTDSLIIDIAHNTIYLDASSSTSTNFGTSGIHQNSSSNGNYERFIFRNNIVVNLSTPKGTGTTVAFRRNSTNNSNYDARSNRNVYYSGIPSSTHLLFTNGTSSYFTLNGYKTYIATSVPTAERNSFTENVAFQSIVGSDANFLKFDTIVPTGVESGGYKVSSVKGDFLKSARAGDIDYTGIGFAPDLGAWELDGIISAPCNGIPTSSSAMISNVSPCSDSSFAISLSNIYNTGTTYQWQASTIDSSTGFVSINGATESYYITSANIDTWYRCIVTCSFGNQTITSSAVLANVSPLNGTYVISNTGSGNYISFAAAIADLHCKNASGPVVFEVVDGQIFNETVNLSIRYNGIYPITFKKQSNGVNPKIRRAGTSATTNYILQLLGADHIIFDGIDFEQTGTAASSWVEFGIQLTNNGALDGAQNNSFKNGIITLTNASVNTIGVNCHSSSPLATSLAGTNSFNRFVNMTVQNCIQGFRFDNTSTNVLDDGNEVVGESGSRGNINTLGTLTASATAYGIYASEQRNFKVDAIDINGCQNTSLLYGI